MAFLLADKEGKLSEALQARQRKRANPPNKLPQGCQA